jgi:hypothetical protein
MKGDTVLELFLQIFLANIVLLFLLISVHEWGHWLMGFVVGMPPGKMKIRLFTFPQQVVLRDGEEWVSVSTFDRYFSLLTKYVPSKNKQFVYVAGGFLFETLFLTSLVFLLKAAGYWLFAIVAPGVSLVMYLIYVFAMDLPQTRQLKRPWGDTTILYSLAPRAATAVVVAMVVVRLLLIYAGILEVFK